MIDIAAELAELETFIRKETRIPNVSVIAEPQDTNGVRCHIDHGSSDVEIGPSMTIQVFPVTVTLKDVKQNWRAVMANALIVHGEVKAQKPHKWQAGAIERIEDVSDYILRLNISIKLPFA